MVIYYAIATYMSTTNMLLKCHICKHLYVQISANYVSIYTSGEVTVMKM